MWSTKSAKARCTQNRDIFPEEKQKRRRVPSSCTHATIRARRVSARRDRHRPQWFALTETTSLSTSAEWMNDRIDRPTAKSIVRFKLCARVSSSRRGGTFDLHWQTNLLHNPYTTDESPRSGARTKKSFINQVRGHRVAFYLIVKVLHHLRM